MVERDDGEITAPVVAEVDERRQRFVPFGHPGIGHASDDRDFIAYPVEEGSVIVCENWYRPNGPVSDGSRPHGHAS